MLHYRSGGIAPDGKPWPPLPTPTLYLCGAEDGCVLPAMAAGQEWWFSHAFQSEIIPGAGHFSHLEQRENVTRLILDWLLEAAT